jgi:hypothetical protein
VRKCLALKPDMLLRDEPKSYMPYQVNFTRPRLK